LFGDGWPKDPNGLGSSIAAMGQSESDWSNWTPGSHAHVLAENLKAELRRDMGGKPDLGAVTPSEEYFIHAVRNALREIGG
jgi:hypothetical protein